MCAYTVRSKPSSQPRSGARSPFVLPNHIVRIFAEALPFCGKGDVTGGFEREACLVNHDAITARSTSDHYAITHSFTRSLLKATPFRVGKQMKWCAIMRDHLPFV